MKTKYPSIFGALAAVMLVLSFVVPANLVSPTPVAADPGVCKWDALVTPGYLPLKNDVAGPFSTSYDGLVLGWDPIDMAVGGDSNTVLVIAQFWLPKILPTLPATGTFNNILLSSSNNGMTFTSTKNTAFQQQFFKDNNIPRTTYETDWTVYPNIFLVAIAQDNPNFWAIVTSGWDAAGAVLINAPVEVYVSTNGGTKWTRTNLQPTLTTNADGVVRCIDISVDYGGTRDLAVGTTDGAQGGDVYVIKSSGFSGWKKQLFDAIGATGLGDFQAIKFSPTYPSDASLVMVYAQATTTFYNVALRDIDANTSNAFAFTPADTQVPIPGATVGAIADGDINKVDLELPSDFSGQAASLRRAYISIDCFFGGAAKNSWDGILRLDDTTVYVLMDTSANANKSIYSISYFGTYASGKLIAGEHMGYPCTAQVPTWFTDSPTTCPIPCWYPALKPPTGAACQAGCSNAQEGIGAAVVGWRADGKLAFTVTGSQADTVSDGWYTTISPIWTSPALVNVGVLVPHPPFNYTLSLFGGLVTFPNGSLVIKDESAFSISRNNGETWNQLALIDTYITRWTDVAPTPDCKTLYLASVNTNPDCCGFDSVWRTSSNPDVVSPYPPLFGVLWERVFTHVTSDNCTNDQTDAAILRLVPYCADPTGQIVAWGVYDHNRIVPSGHGVAAWSPDFGDYWAMITPRDPIQDMAFESSTVLYFLSPLGTVQKMPYTGTAWSSALPSVDSIVYQAHTIAAFPEGKVLVGADQVYHGLLYAASISLNFNTDTPTFAVLSLAGKTPYGGNVHVAFDPAFNDNNTIYIGDDDMGGTTTIVPILCRGSVYRNTAAGATPWADGDMLARNNGAMGCNIQPAGVYGIALAFSGTALYAAHDCCPAGDLQSGVWRTLDNLKGMPKPGIAWDDLNVFVARPTGRNPNFTAEPSSLKLCGCCTLDTDTTLYAIDHSVCETGALLNYSPSTRTGLVWGFTDCMAKRGPALVTEDKTLIGCDPVSGRASEVNLCWEQLCVANAYDIEIAKDADFTIRVVDWVTEDGCGGFFEPVDLTTPCAFFPAGGLAAQDAESDEEAMGSAIAFYGNLECGHTYYWRVKVRECATGQMIRSLWSDVRSFTVKAGYRVVSQYPGLQLLAPANGSIGLPAQSPSFSWSPFGDATKYKFVLAKDAAMTQVVKEAETTSTAYAYDGKLDYSTNYFWRVMAEEPSPSDWSATFSFQTEAAPPPPVTEQPAAPTPLWVWVVIAIGAILVIVTLVLIFKTRRV